MLNLQRNTVEQINIVAFKDPADVCAQAPLVHYSSLSELLFFFVFVCSFTVWHPRVVIHARLLIQLGRMSNGLGSM